MHVQLFGNCSEEQAKFHLHLNPDFVSKAFVLSWNQLIVFDEKMVVLNERFVFKLNLRHSLSPFPDLQLIYMN